jgi:hypothetical protein
LAIPQTNKTRICINVSLPEGRSLNDNVDNLALENDNDVLSKKLRILDGQLRPILRLRKTGYSGRIQKCTSQARGPTSTRIQMGEQVLCRTTPDVWGKQLRTKLRHPSEHHQDTGGGRLKNTQKTDPQTTGRHANRRPSWIRLVRRILPGLQVNMRKNKH